MATTATVPATQFAWDKDPEADDVLHNPDPIRDRRQDLYFNPFSARGWGNVIVLFALIAGLVMLFAGYPIIVWWRTAVPVRNGFNLGGINASGQIPVLPGVRGLLDPDTPPSAFTRAGHDGQKYNLVFSDEFNTDGRTFYAGDDPYWEAVDFHYWATGDLEWYDPSAATTADGKLVLTMTQEPIHNLNFKSAMLQSWNKMCFTNGYIEVSVSLPGSSKAPGFWPGAWTMGNLGRAGYGATTEGMWPYSYDTCDLGTYPNQTDPNGNPREAATGGNDGGPLSFLPGQRLSACTCPGSDHPGPTTSTGRGAPEIDIIEAQIDTDLFRGEVSQSFQIAPYNMNYKINKAGTTIYDTSVSKWNSYEGGPFQQAVSVVSYIDDGNYGGNNFATYGFEYWTDPKHRDDGFITWYSQGQPSWTMLASAVGPDAESMVSQRLISEEPMYVILNFGIAEGFQRQDFKHLQFPAKMYVDYVRVYQREGTRGGVTCNPPSRPTMDYIQRHIEAYTNANLTTWHDAGNTFPRNSKYDGC
ncbi:glycoside hydrolase family 16 protein [Marasmius fiardii PR-910]|nr:glycoside hydrolase family 16 protein [Marasmius fiardii PR-910]